MLLPEGPKKQVDRLKSELALIPERHREDALQEAWVGYLEARRDGKKSPMSSAIRAAKAYAFREVWHEEREVVASQQ